MALGIKMQLATGREVNLARLHLLPSIIDWTVGVPPKRMVDQLPELVERHIGTGLPWLVKNPRDTEMPITCIALFESTPLISHSVTIENSLLVVCWFINSVDQPLRNIACSGLAGIEWEKHAQDYYSDW